MSGGESYGRIVFVGQKRGNVGGRVLETVKSGAEVRLGGEGASSSAREAVQSGMTAGADQIVAL